MARAWVVGAMAGAIASLTAGVAAAREVSFRADLRGDEIPTNTGSKATGQAQIVVDTDRQTVDMTLDVVGLKVDQLWGRLVAAPIGPIHLHLYGSHDHSNPDASELVLSAPYGPTYQPTATGFRVMLKKLPYGDAQRVLESKITFEHFLSSMESGAVRLNIHTNAQNAGEISGEVKPAGAPAMRPS